MMNRKYMINCTNIQNYTIKYLYLSVGCVENMLTKKQ